MSYEKSFLDIAATRTDDSYTIKEVVSFTINEAFYHDDENNKHDTPDEIVKQFEKGLLEESEERAI